MGRIIYKIIIYQYAKTNIFLYKIINMLMYLYVGTNIQISFGEQYFRKFL